MPVPKKVKRAKKPRGAHFLVVRGAGNVVLVAQVKKEFRDPKLARALDALRVVRGAGAIRSPRAFIVNMEALEGLDHSTEFVFRPGAR